MSEELSPAEQKLASELAKLVTDPDDATRRAIMRAVMHATYPDPSAHRLWLPWRLVAAVAATIVLLTTGTMGAWAASSNAVPSNPAYQIRLAGEDIRLTFAGPKDREQLRIDFADERFRQAQQIARNNRADAQLLLRDGRRYLTQAHDDFHALSPDEQGQVQNQLDQAENVANQAQSEVDQAVHSEPSPAVQPQQNAAA